MLHVNHHDANLSEIPLVGDTVILKENFSGTYMHMEKLILIATLLTFKMNKRVHSLPVCLGLVQTSLFSIFE